MGWVEFLIAIVINALWVWGFHVAHSPGMILGGFGDELDEIFGKWWSKPIHRCPTCMSSVHGTIFFILTTLRSLSLQDLSAWICFDWLVFVVALSGLNWLVGSGVELCDSVINKNQESDEELVNDITDIVLTTSPHRRERSFQFLREEVIKAIRHRFLNS